METARMQQHIDQHMQRQIDELKGDVRQLAESFNDSRIESKAERTEIIGLIKELRAEVNGEYNGLRNEVHANRLKSDDDLDRALQTSAQNHQVAMKRIDNLKASRTVWLSTAIAAGVAFVASMVGGWAENFFGK